MLFKDLGGQREIYLRQDSALCIAGGAPLILLMSE